MDPGIRTTRSLGRVLFRYDEVLRPSTPSPDPVHPLDVIGRSTKVVLLDAPLAFTVVVLGHEVFGHGGRAREQGLSPEFKFRLVEPYRRILGQDDGFTGMTYVDPQNQVDLDWALIAGGIEADHRTAYWITLDVMKQDGWAHYGDMLMYAAARLSYMSSLLSPADNQQQDDDVHGYVSVLQRRFNRWTARDRVSIESGLRTAYLWNLIDPTLLFAGYAVVAGHIGRGERWQRAPLPRVGEVAFLPWPSFSLSPFGAEHGLHVLLEKQGVVLDVNGRIGSSGLASYGGGGLRASGIPTGNLGSVSVHVDGWTQPEMLLTERNVFDRPQRVGGNVGAEGTLRLSPTTGLVLGLAYKTRGFLPGRPLDRGMHGYTGLAWTAP